MDITPRSDKELAEMNLWQPGQYSFEVIPSVTLGQNTYLTEERLSTKNNPMIQLVLRVYNSNGRFITVRDFLMDSIPHKLKHAAYTCGLQNEYDSGRILADDFIGKHGVLELKIKRDPSGQYDDRNEVKDYVVSAAPKVNSHNAAKANGFAPELDDEIPYFE